MLPLAQMFIGDGAVDGVRLLRPETHTLMTSNHLTESQRSTAELLSSGHGFGLGVAVVPDPEKADPILCGGSMGWPGAWGGWWQTDPIDNSVLIFLAHNMGELNQFAQGVGFGVFDLRCHPAISVSGVRPPVLETRGTMLTHTIKPPCPTLPERACERMGRVFI